MADDRKVPEIRFKGFADEWEQRKVKDLFKVTRGYVLPAWLTTEKKTEETSYPVYSSQTKDDGLMGYYKDYLYEDAITWTTDGANAGTVNYRAGKFYCTNVCGVLLTDNIKASKMISEALNNVAKSYVSYVGNPKLMNNVMAEIEISLPKQEAEREAMSSYFDEFDHLITLHQRKYDKLVSVKKMMLEKMFPKNGSKVPEVRFTGFTDNWEWCKLGEIASYRRGSFPQPYGNSEWYDGDEAMPFIQVADVGDNMKLVANTKQKISKKAQPKSVFVPKNSVIVTLQGTIGRVAVTQYDAFLDRTVLYFEKYKEKINIKFWSYIIKEKFIDEARRAPGGTIKTITEEVLSDFDLMIPLYAEQKQIGTCLQHIDNLITFHQCKLEKLKQIKKSMLKKMFV